MNRETCTHCGSVLLWAHGQLVCARRDCAEAEPGTASLLGRNRAIDPAVDLPLSNEKSGVVYR